MAMPKKSLAIIPNGGCDIGKCSSLKENTWLVYLDKQNEKEEGPNFVLIRSRYCRGLAQKAVGPFFLDGFRILRDGSRECYEFYRCYYHGCPYCFPDRSKVVRHKHREYGYHTVEMAYQDTTARELEIKSILQFESGFDKWICIWEHEYNEKEKEFHEFLGLTQFTI